MPTLRRLVALVLATGLLTGCGLRVETPAPAPLVPDAAEQARDLAAYRTNDLMTLANQVRPTATEPVKAVVDQVLATSWAHYRGLGGIYYSAYPPELSPTSEPREVRTYPVDAEGLVAALVDAAADAADGTVAATDPDLARLFASMAVARAQLAADLAAATGQEFTPVFGPELWAGAAPTLDDPPVADLVTHLDSLGYGFEVMAARQADPIRSHALADAAHLRSLAAELAELTGVAGTAADTRLGAYQLPNDLRDPAGAVGTAVGWYASLATTWASLIGTAPAADRAWLIRALAAAEDARLAWAPGTFDPFPGLPD